MQAYYVDYHKILRHYIPGLHDNNFCQTQTIFDFDLVQLNLYQRFDTSEQKVRYLKVWDQLYSKLLNLSVFFCNSVDLEIISLTSTLLRFVM